MRLNWRLEQPRQCRPRQIQRLAGGLLLLRLRLRLRRKSLAPLLVAAALILRALAWHQQAEKQLRLHRPRLTLF